MRRIFIGATIVWCLLIKLFYVDKGIPLNLGMSTAVFFVWFVLAVAYSCFSAHVYFEQVKRRIREDKSQDIFLVNSESGESIFKMGAAEIAAMRFTIMGLLFGIACSVFGFILFGFVTFLGCSAVSWTGYLWYAKKIKNEIPAHKRH
jgi:hypothetical protein